MVVKVLDLFSGIGGFSVGLEKAGFETAAFCEIEEYPRAVLRKNWPDIPIYRDVKQLTGERLWADGIVPDVIVCGYPCQPFSVAGKQLAERDERHLFPEVLRLVRDIRPRWCIFENVSGHIKLGYDTVATSMENEGYSVWTYIIPACAVGAPHKRDRLWIVAYSNRDDGWNGRGSEPQERQTRVEHRGSGERQLVGQPSETVADTDKTGLQGWIFGRQDQEWQSEHGHSGCSGSIHRQSVSDFWAVESDVGRVANGIPNRSHRIKCLGNAVVPQIAQIIGQTIMRYEAEIYG
jgi:DNA (cytosine-5)-methyltransferase 1